MRKFRLVLAAVFAVIVVAPALHKPAYAQTNTGAFSLQVSPSTIVETIKPGASVEKEVKIRNTGTSAENLKMALRSFTVDSSNGDVKLGDSEPAAVKDWVQFENPEFSIEAGASFTQKVRFAVPESAGFSYSFALYITRVKEPEPQPGKTTIQGSVAIFVLLSIDRPDAKTKLEIAEFTSKRSMYEYLPADFSLKLKNGGNVILRPGGNIFIQRKPESTEAIAVLNVNGNGAYILPDVTRSMSAQWDDGFPVYKSTGGNNDQKKLSWDFGQLQKLRIGRYTAKAVVVYNDGTRDIPVTATLRFWVMPWKLLLGAFVMLVILGVGIFTIVRKSMKLTRKKK